MLHVIGSVHSYQLWEEIHDHFLKLNHAKACQLRSTTRKTKLVSEFMLRIEAIADSLASIGDLITPQEYIDVILEGLPQDYGFVISVIESKFEPLLIKEVELEALLTFTSRIHFFHMLFFKKLNMKA